MQSDSPTIANHLLIIFATVFTVLHGMQTRFSNENSVCLFVRPSVKLVICDKMKE